MEIIKVWVPALAVLALVSGSPASAKTSAPRATPATSPGNTVIAVTGTNGHLYSKTSTGGFVGLGGAVRDAPAVAYSPITGRIYYVVKGTDSSLYIRTNVTGFSRIGGYCLYGPAAGIFSSEIVIACIGVNHALYYASATLGVGNPIFHPFVFQGGYATQGPAIFFQGTATPNFAVVGSDEYPGFPGFNVYSRSSADVPGGYHALLQSCIGQPDAVSDATTYGFVFFGCRNGAAFVGTAEQLYYEWNGSANGTFGSGYQAEGLIVGRVGIAPAVDNSAAVVYVTGSNCVVYSKQIYAGYDVQPPGFAVVGGCALPGVAAATIG